ncbi:hypothetical protein F5878DRAFT_632041 [Lentinula raphanica]|uniref:Cupin type-2 domain-containing protein n=1 Tax=Lentinula raphanica TaxID=153919 RepID=A0AA38UCY0_9AGAR|nr:hypothetical protein C8R42DRAFT_626134 [Lentinula raphanica]KAJ3833822.1 hypothetical protein F5878DRAFT_632041 [Lentinula raphanica]
MSSSDLPDLRRIVTSHNPQGLSNIQTDNQVVFEPTPLAPGINIASIWKIVDGIPTGDNNIPDDGAKRQIEGLVPSNGANVQMTELAPGAITPNHRTSSIDCNFLLAGELVLVMEDGSETTLTQTGDSVITKGGMHIWKNPSSTKWCRWMTVLMSAEPVVVNGETLGPLIK